MGKNLLTVNPVIVSPPRNILATALPKNGIRLACSALTIADHLSIRMEPRVYNIFITKAVNIISNFVKD